MKNAITLGALLVALAALPQQAQEKGGAVRVQINYTGTGTVDQNHKIFVALWDSPDFAQPNAQVMPVEIKYLTAKVGIVSFSNVQKSPAYFSAAYDPKGTWDGHSGPPPAGSSLGMYSKAPPQPEAVNVAPGTSAKVAITFDDSQKMM